MSKRWIWLPVLACLALLLVSGAALAESHRLQTWDGDVAGRMDQ